MIKYQNATSNSKLPFRDCGATEHWTVNIDQVGASGDRAKALVVKASTSAPGAGGLQFIHF